ncbi:hypothetical protein [Flavobacterium rhizosphaerae]|uniref:DUF4142 domain-containing protein n=1 Tax=Flavobacterium rhizosphaerae TaxID=3163298 RepID=A0ABW8YWF0_9FLAO
MKLVFLFLSAFCIVKADLATVRQVYISASTSEDAAAKLYDMVKDADGGNATITAYKAAALTLKAKYTKPLFDKKKYFTEGAKLLESTIEKDPDNYEARLIRLNIQENAPKITGYFRDVDEDKAFLVKHFDSQSQDLKEFTRNFVKISSSFTEEEKAAFN